MTKSNDRLNAKYSSTTSTQTPANGKTTAEVTGNNAQKGLGNLEQTMRTMGEQLGDNLTNVVVSTALGKVFSNLANGDYGSIGNNYLQVLEAFSEGIESSNLALIASESTTNFLPAGSSTPPETASLTVSKLDA